MLQHLVIFGITNSFEKDFEFIKQGTIEKTGISSSEYDEIFYEQEYNIAQNIRRKTAELSLLIELFQKIENPTFTEIAQDLNEKRKYLEKKFF